jgi:hypothetical protein
MIGYIFATPGSVDIVYTALASYRPVDVERRADFVIAFISSPSHISKSGFMTWSVGIIRRALISLAMDLLKLVH